MAPSLSAYRLLATVVATAVVVHVGALWNRFAMDDLYIIVLNPLVRGPAGAWQIVTAPYWPAEFGGQLYRPLPVLSYALDRLVGSPAWFHAVNLIWHAGASAVVAALTLRLAGARAALVAGLLFAVHPVHVEAVANVVGRAELMAAAGAGTAVLTALAGRPVSWSLAAFAFGLLCKENAAVAPALIAWGWTLGMGRPTRRRALAFLAGWLAVAAAYAAIRHTVLAPYARFQDLAPVFVGADATTIRLTAITAFTDFARLLVAPLTLRADYSPLERTAATGIGDPRVLLGLAVFAAWVALLTLAWRRQRLLEAFGLGWVGIALLPVANLIVPVGVLVAERTLYLPSAGLAIAAGVTLARVRQGRLLGLVAATLVCAGAARTVTRVPVWRDDVRVATSILDDSPNSYRGPARTGGLLQSASQPDRALRAFERAIAIFPRDAGVLVAAADAALTTNRTVLADSLLARADALCPGCDGLYRFQAAAARARGDSLTAVALLERSQRDGPP